jgi:predicted DsbA family dithiol-disulfide isomerase
MPIVEVTYFSDLLCVWAYVSQARIDAVKEKFGNSVRIKHRFCSVFGDTVEKINSSWKDKNGYEGFNLHLRHVAERFLHIEVHPEIWLKTRPLTSASPHLFLKAAVGPSIRSDRKQIRTEHF